MDTEALMVAAEQALFSRVSPLNTINPMHPQWVALTLLFIVLLFLMDALLRRKNRKYPSLYSLFRKMCPPGYFRFEYFGLDIIYWSLNIVLAFVLFYLQFPKNLITEFWALVIPDQQTLTNALAFEWSDDFYKKLTFSVLFVLIQDLASYVSHRCVHEVDILWRFHKIHHHPKMMSPLTFLRIHPVENIFRTLVLSFFISAFFRVFHPLLDLDVGFYVLSTPLLFFFNNLYNNFSHSHLWIHWPGICYLFRSPAMHLIHHDYALNREGKNYSNIFAFWDGMFGTLLVPKKEEPFRFGLETEDPRQKGFFSSFMSPFQKQAED